MIRPRARHVRIVIQALFLLAFLALFWGLAEPRVPATVASILLALDPLTAIGTALSDWTIAGWTWLGLAVLGLTAIFGRFFCGWICPLGTLQQLVSWVAGPERRKRYKINRYHKWFSIKYIILTDPPGLGRSGRQPHRLARSHSAAPPRLCRRHSSVCGTADCRREVG